jgi:hypothetical protein
MNESSMLFLVKVLRQKYQVYVQKTVRDAFNSSIWGNHDQTPTPDNETSNYKQLRIWLEAAPERTEVSLRPVIHNRLYTQEKGESEELHRHWNSYRNRQFSYTLLHIFNYLISADALCYYKVVTYDLRCWIYFMLWLFIQSQIKHLSLFLGFQLCRYPKTVLVKLFAC